jgi:hypothetical protein
MNGRGARVHGLSSKPAELNELIRVVRSEPNGEIAMVERQIAAFETKYGMSSAEVIDRVERGEVGETVEIGAWLMSLRLKEYLASVKARGR